MQNGKRSASGKLRTSASSLTMVYCPQTRLFVDLQMHGGLMPAARYTVAPESGPESSKHNLQCYSACETPRLPARGQNVNRQSCACIWVE